MKVDRSFRTANASAITGYDAMGNAIPAIKTLTLEEKLNELEFYLQGQR